MNFLPEGMSGICSEACKNDGDCSVNQKCCSNGCGHTCMDVVDTPRKLAFAAGSPESVMLVKNGGRLGVGG